MVRRLRTLDDVVKVSENAHYVRYEERGNPNPPTPPKLKGTIMEPTKRTYHTYTDLEYDFGMVKLTITGVPANWNERLNDHVIDGPLMVALSDHMSVLQRQAKELEAKLKASMHLTGEVRDGAAVVQVSVDDADGEDLYNAWQREVAKRLSGVR